jgi:hypothetical protein
MQLSLRLLIASGIAAAIGGAVFVAVTTTTVRSERFTSLADFIAAICVTPLRSSSPEETPYLSENITAMTKMMVDMGIRPSGDVDADFVAMMVPHHQGAIEMAQAELRYGHNERLRRMAQEIIVTQLQEITAMRSALGPQSASAPNQSVSPNFTPDTATQLVKEP